MQLAEYCDEINKECLKRQDDDKEYITKEEAFRAYAYVRNMLLRQPGDVILYCASLNLLNTFVKQKEKIITYRFKKDLDYLLGFGENKPCDDVVFDFQMDGKNPLLVVQIYSLQFSFHNISIPEEFAEFKAAHSKGLPWDGIRKQKCALTVWKMAEKNEEQCCNKTFRGKDLKQKIERMSEQFEKGEITFNDLG